MTDYKELLIKYVAHVVASDGPTFLSTEVAPCGMLSMEFTDEEKEVLERDIFVLVGDWDKRPY